MKKLLRFVGPEWFFFQTPVAEHDQVQNETLERDVSNVLKEIKTCKWWSKSSREFSASNAEIAFSSLSRYTEKWTVKKNKNKKTKPLSNPLRIK